jgi:hypothetical protein
MKLWEVPRIPVTFQDLTDGAPSKLCKGARKEDMPSIFHLTAKSAVARGRAMARRNLLARRQSVEDELPSENFDLQRHFG